MNAFLEGFTPIKTANGDSFLQILNGRSHNDNVLKYSFLYRMNKLIGCNGAQRNCRPVQRLDMPRFMKSISY